MGQHEMRERILNKVESAARENFDKYNEEFANMETIELFKTGYLHGFNCGYNIYDAAEERVEGLIKKGVMPQKESPTTSSSILDYADEYLKNNSREVLDLDDSDAYVLGYRQGFNESLGEDMLENLNEKIYNLVDYYLTRNK